MTTTIAIVSQKGGAGKSPTAIHLSYALAQSGNKILFVDADAQASASLHFLGAGYANVEPTLYDAIVSMVPVDPIVVADRLHLLSAHDQLTNAEITIVDPNKPYQTRLLRLLTKYKGYDYIIIDTPGSNISVFTTLALSAATFAIIPVKTEFAAERAMTDTMNLIDDIKGSAEEPGFNPGLTIWGILPTQYESNVKHHREVFDSLKDQYGDLVYPKPSKKTNKYNDATASRCDIRDLTPTLGLYWDELASCILQKER